MREPKSGASEMLHQSLETEIKDLSAEVAEKQRIEKLPEKEALHAVIKEKVQAAQPIISPAQSASQRQPVKSPFLPDYAQADPIEIRLEVERLLDLAVHKGPTAAIKEAIEQKPRILDVFHDALVDKLYLIMKEKKYI